MYVYENFLVPVQKFLFTNQNVPIWEWHYNRRYYNWGVKPKLTDICITNTCICNTFILNLQYNSLTKISTMDIALKKNQSFRLSVDLIDKLKQLAKRQNRSLNNYVETVLLDAAYHSPNATTLEAMKEAESDLMKHVEPLDMSSIEAMERSM